MKNLTLRYSVTQFTYWAASSGAAAFATTYLLDKGVPAGAVGLMLALAGLISCLTQPILAAFADRAEHFLLTKMLGVDAILIAGIVMAGIGTLIIFATVTKKDSTRGETQ